jgi:hypothetical protein
MASGDLQGDLAIVAIVGILVSPFVLYIAVRMFFSHRRQRRANEERADANRREAESYFQRLSTEGGTAVQSSLIMSEGEYALLSDDATLFETRSYRVHAGGGTRIKGIYVGGGASDSRQAIREIGAGTLVLTNRRLVFDGSTENRTIKLTDILSASPMLDAIEVSTQKRQKSMIFAVPNPLIWAPMIQHAASGHIAPKAAGQKQPQPNS